jgi:homoserine/homoserine lactone efflux protein
LLVASAQAFWVVKVLGAGYLIWLGWNQWRSPVAENQAALPGGEGALSARQRLLRGLLTNMTNPKGIVFMVAVLPQFIDPQRPLWLQLLILLVTTVATDVVVMHGYAWLAASLQGLLRTARARRVQNRVFGGVLMVMGASLMLVRRGATNGA